jgi:hypothetical protein
MVIAKRFLWDWLREVYSPEEIDRAAVVAAGHHRKFPVRAVAESGTSAARCTVRLAHPDFARVLQIGVKQLGLPAVLPALEDQPVARHEAEQLLDEAHDECVALSHNDVDLAVAKAFLLAADVLGSAEPTAARREQFVDDALARRATREELASIAETRLKGKQPRQFQREVAASSAPVTLATAGCGTGKTVAAYLWAQQHAGRQLWFCYPTTGTATEGFKGYLKDIELETRLEHGRREVDLELLGLADGYGQGDLEEAQLRDMARVESLWGWGAKAISCTVDTVLGLLQCQRKGMYAWPGLADAAFVFDEIHAYDARMFGGLLRLLEAMPGAPVLLMTATLPAARLERLRAVVRAVHRRPMVEIRGPAELERLPRYTRLEADPREAVLRCLAEGGRVLWVCNTVGRSQESGSPQHQALGDGLDLVPHVQAPRQARESRHLEIRGTDASPQGVECVLARDPSFVAPQIERGSVRAGDPHRHPVDRERFDPLVGVEVRIDEPGGDLQDVDRGAAAARWRGAERNEQPGAPRERIRQVVVDGRGEQAGDRLGVLERPGGGLDEGVGRVVRADVHARNHTPQHAFVLHPGHRRRADVELRGREQPLGGGRLQADGFMLGDVRHKDCLTHALL